MNEKAKTMRPCASLRARTVMGAAIWAVACSALSAPPKEIFITREQQDLYRIASGPLYLKTVNCHEVVYGDKANLRFNIGGKGGAVTFRNGRACVIERLYKEVDPYATDTFTAAKGR